MPSLKFLFKKKDGKPVINLKGLSVIQIQYHHKAKTCYFSTGVLVKPSDFNTSKAVFDFSKHKDKDINEIAKEQMLYSKLIKKKMDSIQKVVSKLLFEDKEPTIDVVRDIVKPKPIKEKVLNPKWTVCFEEFKKGNSDIQKATFRNYETLNSTLKKWLGDVGIQTLELKDIDYDFYNRFKNYMFKEMNLFPNSVGERVKRLKAFLNYFDRLGYEVSKDVSRFSVYRVPKRIIYLTEKELEKVQNFEFEEKDVHLERVRDIFVVGCHTGLRISDLMRVSGDMIFDGMLYLTTRKTQTQITVPVSMFTEDVLDKYDGCLPKISDVKYNLYIKQMAKKAKINNLIEVVNYNKGEPQYSMKRKWEVITSHTSVKTFLTIGAINKLDHKVLSSVTGKDVRTIMKYYQAVSPEFLKSEVKSVFG